VYVSVLGDDTERDSSVEVLKSASGLLQRRLKERVLLRRLPKLEFLPDRDLEDAADMLALIDRVAAEDAQTGWASEDEEPEGR
jgi:ribosome-binding factor A